MGASCLLCLILIFLLALVWLLYKRVISYCRKRYLNLHFNTFSIVALLHLLIDEIKFVIVI